MVIVRPLWRVDAPPVVILEFATLLAPPSVSAASANWASPANSTAAKAAAVTAISPITIVVVLFYALLVRFEIPGVNLFFAHSLALLYLFIFFLPFFLACNSVES